jgi:predicted ester cyclase
VHDPQYPEALRGRDAIRDDMAALSRSFPDLHGEVRSLLVDGSSYTFEVAISGTHQGAVATPSGEIPPSGNRVEIRAAVFGELDG